MKKLRVGINGFGRIGRIAARIIAQRPKLELVAVNSRADSFSHAYLLQYDSVYGTFPQKVKAEKDFFYFGNISVKVFSVSEPAEIDWQKAKVDIVIESSGKFREKEKLVGHLQRGPKYVVLSAPAKDRTKTLILGVNEDQFEAEKDKIVSNSSCTTNCLAVTLKVLADNFGVERGFMTTVHAVTDSQNLLDNSHKKEVRLRRSAFLSLIPASTGSAKDIAKIFPELAGKIFCQALRVPLPTVSLIVLSVQLKKKVTKEIINRAFLSAAKNRLRGILAVADEELVSVDYRGNPHSAIIDPYLTAVNGEHFASIYAWYDNEWGYTSRLVDLVEFIGRKAHLL